MILVDSSVWIAYFNGIDTPQAERLDALLARESVGLGDLILTEVLQGFRQDTEHDTAKELLTSLTVYELLGLERAVRCAANYRLLRTKGVTIRKTVDVIIATFCIDNRLPLLHADKDFEPFRVHLGLNTLS